MDRQSPRVCGIGGRQTKGPVFPGGTREKREFATFGPVAPGESESSNVAFECQGHLRNDQLASIFMLVEYRDAFKKGRVTTCGYKVSGKHLERLIQFPERNYHK